MLDSARGANVDGQIAWGASGGPDRRGDRRSARKTGVRRWYRGQMRTIGEADIDVGGPRKRRELRPKHIHRPSEPLYFAPDPQDVHESQYYRQRDDPANRTEHDCDDVRGRQRARSRCRGPRGRGSGDLGWMIASGGGAVAGGKDGEGRGEGEGSDVCFHGGPGGAMRSAAGAEAREGAPAARCETRARGGGRERDHRLRWWRVESEGKDEEDESAGSGWGGSALDD